VLHHLGVSGATELLADDAGLSAPLRQRVRDLVREIAIGCG
jgi:hypothetical protein